MDLKSLYEILKETEIGDEKIVYGQFEEGEAPELPWIVYYSTGELPFFADNTHYFTQLTVTIELYTDLKSPETEERLEEVLLEHNIDYQKEEHFIDEEDFYVLVYTTYIH